MNRFSRIPVLVASLLLGVSAFGSVAMAQPEQSQAAHHQHNRRAHRGGARGDEGMLGFALHHVTLNPEQRTKVEQIEAGLRPSREAVKSARKDLALALATEVGANNVDAASLQPKVDALQAAVAAEKNAERSSIEQLHVVLDTTQRAELASGMEAQMNAREQAHGQRRAQHQANAQNGQAHEGRGRGLARALNLTPAQAQQVRSIMQSERASAPRPDFQAMHAQRVAMLESFKGVSFSMAGVPNEGGARAKASAERFIDAAGKITQILTPEQRTVAAQKLTAAAEHGGMKL